MTLNAATFDALPLADRLFLLRGLARGKRPVISDADLRKAQAFFARNTTASAVLLYPDGLVIGNDEVPVRREAAVAHAQANGWFPVTVSRTAASLWEAGS